MNTPGADVNEIAGMKEQTEDLWNEFVSPPDSARPRAWWHWMDGNVELEGIRADLCWLHSVGVRGVQAFDGALGSPLVVKEAIVPGSEQWREAISIAVTTAHELGLDFTVTTSAGWSAAGAPWVEQADAMRKLVWSQTVVEGGELIELNKLPDVAGPYQNMSRWGAGPSDGTGDAKDLFAVAIAFDSAHDALEPAFVRTSDSPTDWVTFDQSITAGGFRLARDPDNDSVAWLEQRFPAPVTVRSCVIELPGHHGFGAAPPATATLQVQNEAGDYSDVATLPVTQCPSRTMSFPPVAGERFRLRLQAAGISAVLAAFEKGVQPPPVFQPLAQSYYGTLSEEAHKRGAIYYAEALEDRRPQLGDDLAMRSHADVPMGASWTFKSEEGPAPTYVADLKGAASVAHVYGRQFTGAEAFTSGQNPWSDSPKSLKHVADLQLTLGVTRFCIHTSPHQPTQVPPPGIALAPSLGQAFTRNETWASTAKPWIDYLARCSHLLSLGRPAVDIAYFIGEEAPVTALFGNTCNEDVPADYDYDYIGPDALSNVLTASGGELQAGTSRYKLLYLGGASNRMSTGALKAILRLVQDGATIVGVRPASKRSLADDDHEHQRLCDLIWGNPTNGRVYATADLGSVLQGQFRPDVTIGDTRVRRIARWVDGEQLLLFIANPLGDELCATVTLPDIAGNFVAWNPVTLTQQALERSGEGFDVRLSPYSSLFILPGDAPPPGQEHIAEVDGAWTLTIPGSDPVSLLRAAYWTDLHTVGKQFSGTATYRFEFQLHTSELPQAVQFADVADIAQIKINGEEAGILWTAPYRVFTNALRPGTNRIEIRVTNPWRNRLIAEASNNSGTLYPPMTAVFNKEAEILPAGLLGPVSLVFNSGGTGS